MNMLWEFCSPTVFILLQIRCAYKKNVYLFTFHFYGVCHSVQSILFRLFVVQILFYFLAKALFVLLVNVHTERCFVSLPKKLYIIKVKWNNVQRLTILFIVCSMCLLLFFPRSHCSVERLHSIFTFALCISCPFNHTVG